MKARKFDHQSYIPYLLRRVTERLNDRFTLGLEPYGLTIPMWRILAVLHRRGATRFGLLREQTQIEPPTLSRLVEHLRKEGYITRKSSRVDARGVLISPSAKALKLIEDLTPHAFEVERETTAGLSRDEAETFRQLLKRVCDRVAPFPSDDEGQD